MHCMKSDLVDIAAFDSPLTANIARSRLEAEGISAFLDSEHTVGTQWLWTNAIGGVKLLVPAADAERAKAVLADAEAGADAATESPSEVADDLGERPTEEWEQEPAAIPEPYDQPSSREEDAVRALKSAVLGLVFCPLQLYTAWLLILVVTNREPLRKRYFWCAVGAWIILLPYIITMVAAPVFATNLSWPSSPAPTSSPVFVPK